MIIIPNRQTKIIKQNNRGKVLGDLWASWNIDLQSNPGFINVSTKMKLNGKTSDVSGLDSLGLPIAFQYFDGMVWTLAGDRMFKSTTTNIITQFTEDLSTNSQTGYDPHYSDIITFGKSDGSDYLLTTGKSTKLFKKAASAGAGTGSYTEIGSDVLTDSTNHKMCYLKNYDRVYIFDNLRTIKSLQNDLSTVASPGSLYAIDLLKDVGMLSTMIATDNKIFIGTIQESADSEQYNQMAGGLVIEWDGKNSEPTATYKINAQGVLAMTLLNGIPVIMDTNGVLQLFNGSGFQELGRLPLIRESFKNAAGRYDRFVHPNGMITTKNGTIKLLINNLLSDNAGSILENLPSGIWEWSKDNGFVHRHPLTLQPMNTTTVTDNGQVKIVNVGALANANIFSSTGVDPAGGRATLICGANFYTDATTSTFGIFIDAPVPTDNTTTTESKKYGYFVTQWLFSNALNDSWNKIGLKYRKLLNSSDRIIAKYRTSEVAPTYFSMTWVNTTSFTTTTDLTSYWTYGVGGEIEVLQGTGSGKCAHITNITFSSPNYTVTLDETFTGVTTGTAKGRAQAWNKITEISDQLSESHLATIGKVAERIQIKVCMEFTGDNEFHELIVVNKDHTLIV